MTEVDQFSAEYGAIKEQLKGINKRLGTIENVLSSLDMISRGEFSDYSKQTTERLNRHRSDIDKAKSAIETLQGLEEARKQGIVYAIKCQLKNNFIKSVAGFLSIVFILVCMIFGFFYLKSVNIQIDKLQGLNHQEQKEYENFKKEKHELYRNYKLQQPQ